MNNCNTRLHLLPADHNVIWRHDHSWTFLFNLIYQSVSHCSELIINAAPPPPLPHWHHIMAILRPSSKSCIEHPFQSLDSPD